MKKYKRYLIITQKLFCYDDYIFHQNIISAAYWRLLAAACCLGKGKSNHKIKSKFLYRHILVHTILLLIVLGFSLDTT